MRISAAKALEILADLHEAAAGEWARRAADARRWGLCDDADHAWLQARRLRIDALLNRALAAA